MKSLDDMTEPELRAVMREYADRARAACAEEDRRCNGSDLAVLLHNCDRLLRSAADLNARELPAGASFTCPKCRRTSCNPGDVRQLYCGACHEWFEGPWGDRARP